MPATTLEEFWVDLVGADPIYLALLDSSYVYSAAHDFFSDVSGVLGTPIEITNPTYVGGLLDSPDRPFNYAGIIATEFVTQAWVYVNTGVDATSRLLVYMDQRSDGPPINIEGDGTDFVVDWPLGLIASI